ncbi:MAG: PAS domain-containing protein [Acidobacteria bacterium]|nr:PAS domain-containing protein [Acidobacteriota bacterium]
MSGSGHGARAWSVAGRDRLADLLPDLHQRAVQACGGRCSVLLTSGPQGPSLFASSAFCVEELAHDAWLTSAPGRAAAARAWSTADLVTIECLSQTMPDLAQRLNTSGALLVPLVAANRPLGLLVLGVDEPIALDQCRDAVLAVGDLFTLVLDRARLQREANIEDDLEKMFAELTRSMSSSLTLPSRLESFCVRCRTLVGAARVSVWLHFRRARRLRLIASSDPALVASGLQVPVDDESVPVSAALRRGRAELTMTADHGVRVLAPLRGRRRALGTLSVEGLPVEPDRESALVDRIAEIARQLSSAIENVLLLEDTLRSRRELENAFNSVADLVLVCDRRLHLVHVNQSFAERFHRRQDDMFERPLQGFVGGDVLSWLAARAENNGAPDGAETREMADPVLNGTFAFTLSPLLGVDSELIGMVLVARDVTGQARLEAERAELHDRLAQSEKLAALGQVVAGIAHELNNPLQGVLGHLELLLTTERLAAPVRRDLRLVFREADRAAKIVNNLLVFAGSRRIALRRLNLNRVIRRVLSLRATACRAQNIALVRELEPRLPWLAGDAHLLQQALLNVVINAEQALAARGEGRMLQIVTRADRVRGRCTVVVSDNGPGIPPEALPRLFEPFFTTKEVGQGTGLGLAIAYGIAQEHGGHIAAQNRPDGGALFIIELPCGIETMRAQRR